LTGYCHKCDEQAQYLVYRVFPEGTVSIDTCEKHRKWAAESLDKISWWTPFNFGITPVLCLKTSIGSPFALKKVDAKKQQ
jgi:hypothetical protein